METKDESAILANHAEAENSDFEVGDWVVVQYDKQKYPGEIIDVLNEEVVVSAMHPAGGKSGPTTRTNAFIHFQLLLQKSTHLKLLAEADSFHLTIIHILKYVFKCFMQTFLLLLIYF